MLRHTFSVFSQVQFSHKTIDETGIFAGVQFRSTPKRSEEIMRLFIVPLILVGLLVQAPTTALGNANQRAAERIADAIGERFPDADVDVSFRGGQVWLKGEAASQSQRERIVEQVFRVPGINVTEVNDEIQIIASRTPAGESAQPTRSATAAVNAPVPMPNAPNPRAPVAALNHARQMPQAQAQQLAQPQMPSQTWTGSMLPAHPQQHFPAAYGQQPGQPPAFPAPFVQTTGFIQHPAFMQQPQAAQQPVPIHAQRPIPQQATHHPGQQGPFPGQFHQPNLPHHAWPSYANYPNYAQVSYPRNYSPAAWPYIGPFYPYPQVPLGWRRVTLEHSNGWWWLDFDDGSPSGPFSGLFRQPIRYTY